MNNTKTEDTWLRPDLEEYPRTVRNRVVVVNEEIKSIICDIKDLDPEVKKALIQAQHAIVNAGNLLGGIYTLDTNHTSLHR